MIENELKQLCFNIFSNVDFTNIKDQEFISKNLLTIFILLVSYSIMSFPNMIFYLSLFILQILPLISSDTSQCTLTGFQSKDPYPSLITCYKYNNEACCLSVHDDYIKDQLSSMLTDSCLGKYNELEDLMCLGCHPFEMEYISTNEKGETVLTICKDFVKRLWDVSSDEDLNKSTLKYDNCGFKSEYFNQ